SFGRPVLQTVSVARSRGKTFFRSEIFALQPRDEGADRLDPLDGADALPRSPNVFPRLFGAIAARPKVHLARVALGQIVRVKAARHDRWPEVIAMDPGEEIRINDVARG